jgi:hypothetical protein
MHVSEFKLAGDLANQGRTTSLTGGLCIIDKDYHHATGHACTQGVLASFS